MARLRLLPTPASYRTSSTPQPTYSGTIDPATGRLESLFGNKVLALQQPLESPNPAVTAVPAPLVVSHALLDRDAYFVTTTEQPELQSATANTAGGNVDPIMIGSATSLPSASSTSIPKTANDPISPGAIVGIIVGGVLVLAAGILVTYFVFARKRQFERMAENRSGHTQRTWHHGNRQRDSDVYLGDTDDRRSLY